MKRLGVLLLAVLLFLPSLLASGFVLLPPDQFLEDQLGLPCNPQIKEGTTQYTFHDPILIDGNEDFVIKASAESWDGNGSLSSPYVISGLNITGLADSQLLLVKNTNLSFQINDCLLWGGRHGIFLINVQNGELSNNFLYQNRFGIFLKDSERTRIFNNTLFQNREDGISIIGGGSHIIINNSIVENGAFGIQVYSVNNTIWFNDFIDNKFSPQACEDGYEHSEFAYNYWFDRVSPDNNSDGIVDIPYSITSRMYGVPDNHDLFPQVNPNNRLIIHYISKPKILFPRSRAILLRTVSITVEWRAANDFWGHDIIFYSVFYSPDGGGTWNELASGLISTSVEWNITSLPESLDYRLKVVAFCSEGFTSEDIIHLIRPDHEPISNRGLEYTVSPCYDCEDLHHWKDGEINISVNDQSILFDQILIIWCNFNEHNFILELEQSGSNLTINEKYYTTSLTDCLCPVRITGNITNLTKDRYNLTFNLETIIYDLFNPLQVTRQSSILAGMVIDMFPTSEESATIPSVALTTTTTPVSNQTPSFAFIPLIVSLIALTIVYKRKNS